MRYLTAIAVLIGGCAYAPPNELDEAAPLPVVFPTPVALEAAAETVSGDAKTMSAPPIAPLPDAPLPTEPAKPVTKPTPQPMPEASGTTSPCSPCYQPCYRRLFRRR